MTWLFMCIIACEFTTNLYTVFDDPAFCTVLIYVIISVEIFGIPGL